MRRDVCHYYERNVQQVFDAYYNAATQRFGKNCKAEPFHTLTFGINMSFRYNMNGGACTVHFMPYYSGTAVDVRYSLAQLMGARYGAYDKVMTDYVCGLLGVPAQPVSINVETFLDPRNQVVMNAVPNPAMPPVQAAPMGQPLPNVQPTPAAAPAVCSSCGKPLVAGAKFCPYCGQRTN